MPSFKTFALGASALAFGLAALTAPALADDSNFVGVKDMDVSLSGTVPVVTVRNVAANKLLQNLSLAVQENSIAVGVAGHVECLGTTSENWKWRDGYRLGGGAFGIGRTSLLLPLSKNLPSSSSIDHVQDAGDHTFQVPAGLLDHPQIGVDPIATVLAAAEQAPDKLAWLRQDHVLTVKIPLRWAADCVYYTRNKVTKHTITDAPSEGEYSSYLTKDVNLKIEYKGDPQLYTPTDNSPKLSAQLRQGLPNQIGGGYQPFKITKMNFQPNMPHHIGACPATTTIRLQYEGLGRGTVQIAVHEGAKIIDGPYNFLYDAKNGEAYHYFDIETPKPAASDLNKTVSHNLSVRVRTKDWKSQTWDAGPTQMDSAVWNVRCTPQVNPALGGTIGGGKTGGYQSGGTAGAKPAPALQLKQPQPTPAAPIIRRAQ